MTPVGKVELSWCTIICCVGVGTIEVDMSAAIEEKKYQIKKKSNNLWVTFQKYRGFCFVE
jgi:hypothetical protein